MSVEVCFRYMARQSMKALDAAGIRSARSAKPGWSKAFDLLRYELGRIGAAEVIVEAGYKPEQVRADGWPYSNARPEHHQVRVSFRRGKVPMSFCQGGFSAIEFNVWLIGMTLQALRAVDHYGCTQGGEQYRGWAQLPSGIAASEWANAEEAARWLVAQTTMSMTPAHVLGNPANLRLAFREAASKAHPDAGGSNELMSKVNRARDYIERSAAA